jgi:signal transduction histidine kinase/ActR/RegA family two-component response regulator
MTRPARPGETPPPNSEVPEAGTAERARELAEALEDLRREAAARQAAEEALRKAQKLEAVGQLAGGIAHDFNNHLTSILGGLFLMERRIDQGRSADDLRRYISIASVATRRAGALAQRLLSLARRQPLPDPEQVGVNEVIASMEDLLRSALGPSVTLELALAPGVWSTLCDPGQLENAVLNLAINARDAMPEGGRLVIRTGNIRLGQPRAGRDGDEVEPGDYVMLGITDTGVGMPPDLVARILEPFFTTKPLGQGTGLGIPMVHGFVKQSGGHLEIQSEPGRGTSVRLHLPRRSMETPGLAESASVALFDAPRAEAGETILIVDRISVRALLAEALEDLGYVAIGASDGPSGLHILQSDARIDLLVTEVALSGALNGRQLAKAARERRPGLKVLFITGYAPDAAPSRGSTPEPGTEVMTKPLAVDAFAAKVRSMLSGQGIAPAAGDHP